MGDKVEVIASHPVRGADGKMHEVEDRWQEDRVHAKSIVSSGHARYATKDDAKKAGGDPAESVTGKTA